MSKYTLRNAISHRVLQAHGTGPNGKGFRRTWCYLVENGAGETVGKLKKSRRSWILTMKQKQFVPTPKSAAAVMGITNAAVKGFSTVAKAREFLNNPTFALPR